MMLYMLTFRIRYEKYPIPINVNKGNGAVSKNCLHIKGQLFLLLFFFWSFYFYCLVLVDRMTISTKCIDLLLCTFKTGHLLLIIMVTDCINQLKKNHDSQTIFNS